MKWMVALLLVGGCVEARYAAQVTAPAELTLRAREGLEMWAGGRRVSRALAWRDLENFVGCVPEAREHARLARRDGRTAIALAVLGGVLGAGGLLALGALWDRAHETAWLVSGLSSGALGVTLAGVSLSLRNSSNGHAVDALNFYNDAVGSVGGSCP